MNTIIRNIEIIFGLFLGSFIIASILVTILKTYIEKLLDKLDVNVAKYTYDIGGEGKKENPNYKIFEKHILITQWVLAILAFLCLLYFKKNIFE